MCKSHVQALLPAFALLRSARVVVQARVKGISWRRWNGISPEAAGICLENLSCHKTKRLPGDSRPGLGSLFSLSRLPVPSVTLRSTLQCE